MFKKGLALFLIIIFNIIFASNLRAQNESTAVDIKEKTKQEIRGRITEIAGDEAYIKIEDKKVITSKQFVKDSFIAVGDNVVIYAEETPGGLKAFDFKYIYEEGNDSSDSDDDLITPVEFGIGTLENK